MHARVTHRLLPALLLLLLAPLAGCTRSNGGTGEARAALRTRPGMPLFQQLAALPLPGGWVNLAGGSLLLRRVDLSIDTRLGTRELGASWSSANRRWHWSFQARYDGALLVGPLGTEHQLGQLADGERLPGSVWIREDASRVRTPGGLVHEFSEGLLAALYWSSGPYPRLEYQRAEVAGELRITGVQQCRAPGQCSWVYSVEYDAAGRVRALEDRAGRRAEFDYDAEGRLAAARDGLDVEQGWPGMRYGYAADGQLVSVLNSEGEALDFTLGSGRLGRLLSVRLGGPGGPTHYFEYEGGDPFASASTADRVVYHLDPAGALRSYFFDRFGRLRRRIDPYFEETELDWADFEVSRLTLPDGSTTRWEHLDDDEVVQIEPDGSRVTFDFRIVGGENRQDPLRRPVDEIRDELGLRERRLYADGRLVAVENGEGERTELAYDAENMLARVRLPDGVALSLADYGEHGHPGELRLGSAVATRSYDAVGNLLAASPLGELEPRPGGERERRYDADRNPVALERVDAPAAGTPQAAWIEVDYRSDGRPLAVRRPGGGDHALDYDAWGRLVAVRERVDGSWRTTQFERDTLGRTTAVALPNGMRRETRYDLAGRVAGIRARRDGILESAATLRWQDGRLVEIGDSAQPGPELLHYDAAGRTERIDFPHGESLELEYDLRGRLRAERYRLAGGSLLREIGSDYDLADRRVALREDAAALVEWVYDAGRLAETQTGNGWLRRFSYDPQSGRLVGATSTDSLGNLLEVSTLDVAAVASGGTEWQTQTVTGGSAAALTQERYRIASTDDAGGQLGAWGDGTSLEAHAFDALGNLALGPEGRTLVYNAEGNRLVRLERDGETALEYSYDAAGYVVQRGGEPLGWTASGRLASWGADAHFSWDALGRPLGRELAGELRETRFGGRLEVDAAGTPVELALPEVRLLLAEGARRYEHADFRGNTKLVSDDAGDVRTHTLYAGYGPAQRVGADDGVRSFAGGREVGPLLLLGARPLDPEAGRFLAPDPLLQLTNQYAYALGNPVDWWDPGGMQQQASPVARIRAGEFQMGSGLAVMMLGAVVLTFVPAAAPFGYGLMIAGLNLMVGGARDMVEGLVELEQQGAGTGAGSPAVGGLGQAVGVSAPGFGLPSPSGAPPPPPAPPAPANGPSWAPCGACDAVPGVGPGGSAGMGGAVGFGGFGF